MSQKDRQFDIKIEYVIDGRREKVCTLSQDEYFDPEHRLAGRDAIYSPPRHQQAWKYLKASEKILSTALTLFDKEHGLKRTLATSYWNDMESDLTEVVDVASDGSVTYRELILTQQLSIANMNGWFIERWEWSETRWIPRSGAFVEQRADGTQRDHPIPLDNSKDERR